MRPSSFLGSVWCLLLVALFSCGPAEQAEALDEAQPDQIPQIVLDGLNARFPGAAIQKWTREEEGALVIYDFEFQVEGRKLEADIREDGRIHNWEREVELGEVPDTVNGTVSKLYPGSTITEIMEITATVDEKEALEGYEVVLETSDGQEVEILVSPSGEVLEDSAEETTEQR